MRSLLFIFSLSSVACISSGSDPPGIATQAVAGPGGVTVVPPSVGGVPIAGQLAVSWSPDPAAIGYYVFQSVGGAPYVFVADVIGSNGAAPSPSFVATQLAAGSYCYTVETTYPDGTASDPGPQGCGMARGPSSAPPSSACTDTSTLAQIYQCESTAEAQCTNLGFGGNDFCFAALAQECSCADTFHAQAVCAQHPEISHNINPDGSCHLVWR